jgi:hypothetical protein
VCLTNRSNNVGHVGDGSARRGAQIENTSARVDVRVLDAGHDGGGQLGAERVPHPVLGALGAL